MKFDDITPHMLTKKHGHFKTPNVSVSETLGYFHSFKNQTRGKIGIAFNSQFLACFRHFYQTELVLDSQLNQPV